MKINQFLNMKKKRSNEIKSIFNKISYRYDFLNTFLSLGLHKLWKRNLVDLLKPRKGEVWADLCCGTGDLAFLISSKVSPNGLVIGIDSAEEILSIAKNKSYLVKQDSIIWKIQDVLEIDESINKFDGICMSYGLRNLTNVEEGLTKVFYLLKNKGRAGFLDFNHSKKKSLANIFQKFYLRFVVVPVSKIFKLTEEYGYIEKSINNFPSGEKLLEIASRVGFTKVDYKTIFCRQMGILIFEK